MVALLDPWLVRNSDRNIVHDSFTRYKEILHDNVVICKNVLADSPGYYHWAKGLLEICSDAQLPNSSWNLPDTSWFIWNESLEKSLRIWTCQVIWWGNCAKVYTQSCQSQGGKIQGKSTLWNLIPTNSHKSVLLQTEKDLHHQKGPKRTFGHWKGLPFTILYY